MRYSACKVISEISIDGDLNKYNWIKAETVVLNNYMGQKPEHFPVVHAKIAYDNLAIYVIFSVKDKFIKAVHNNYQSDVWKDSCVEFFFIPGFDRSERYFNLEVNCGGTALFQSQLGRGNSVVKVTASDFNQIELFHSLPKIVYPELSEAHWVIEYRIPYKILEKYTHVTIPKPGTSWLMNLYKCADESSHPHWITWNLVDKEKPDFHLPQYFGELYFE
jgi:hypothetical protein